MAVQNSTTEAQTPSEWLLERYDRMGYQSDTWVRRIFDIFTDGSLHLDDGDCAVCDDHRRVFYMQHWAQAAAVLFPGDPAFDADLQHSAV